ncbi:hypothetical protein L9F63_013737, partial [Diploptera punctata]
HVFQFPAQFLQECAFHSFLLLVRYFVFFNQHYESRISSCIFIFKIAICFRTGKTQSMRSFIPSESRNTNKINKEKLKFYGETIFEHEKDRKYYLCVATISLFKTAWR